MTRRIFPRLLLAFLLAPLLLALAACHSYHVDCAVENQTGAPIQLLEVDYPSASFGKDALAAGATYHYRFVILDEGPLKVQYTDAAGHLVKVNGPALHQHQQGRLRIVLLPGGKAQFDPQLTAPR